MSELTVRQDLFTNDIAKLIEFYNKPLKTSMGDVKILMALKEVQRTQAQAAANAKNGVGIANSLHLVCCAADIQLYYDNQSVCNDREIYKLGGIFWESLSPYNRWGGFFPKHGGSLDDIWHFERKANPCDQTGDK